MFVARRTAVRLLSSQTSSRLLTSRSVSSFAVSSLPRSKSIYSSNFQKRWATSGSGSKDGEVPISQLQPTPQEEVENAISEDNAAATLEGDSVSATDSAAVADASKDFSTAAQDNSAAALEGESVAENDSQVALDAGADFSKKLSTAQEDDAAAAAEGTSVLGNDEQVVRDAGQDFPSKVSAAQEDDAAAAAEGASVLGNDEQVVRDAAEDFPAGDRQSTIDKHQAAVSGAGAAAGIAGSQATRRGFPTATPREPKETIYIGNLFFDVTENDLVKELARFGTIKRARLIRDARGLSKGFGYVEFDTVDSAQNAVDSLNQQLFEGRRLNVQFAALNFAPGSEHESRSKPQNPPTKTLFIGNMSFEMTDRDLNNLFKGIRNVVDVRVAIDRRTGQPRGFAHADFIDVKSAMEAMKVLKDKETYGRKLRVDYSYGSSNAPRNTPKDQ